MLGNQVIMKTYKEIKNEYKQINIEKEYENDNYLIQTLKRTAKSKLNKDIIEYENNIKQLLKHIYHEIQLQGDPKVKIVKNENDIFQRDYKSISDNFQKSSKIIFKDIINKYNQKGYKLPDITCEHNLFKINALIEENNNKLDLILREDKKNKKTDKDRNIAMKTLAYLKKLKILINILLSKEENKGKRLSRLSGPKFKIKKKKNETIDDLKSSINQLKVLIKTSEIMNAERKKSLSLLFKRKSTFGGTNNYKRLNKLKSRNSKESSSININLNINLNNNNENKMKTDEGISGSEHEEESKNKYESSNILLNRQNTNKSNKSIITDLTNELAENDKKKKDDTIYFIQSDTNNRFKNPKRLINLKKKSINFINITKEREKVNVTNEEEKSFKIYSNKKKSYSNLISRLKMHTLLNSNKNNNKYLSTYTKTIASSLKKNKTINSLKKKTDGKLKNSKHFRDQFNNYFRSTKNPKVKTAFFLKTQSLEKKNLSRNRNIYLSQNKTSSTDKNQNIILTKRFKTQEEYLESAYKRLKKGNYDNLEHLIRKYLKDIKQLDIDEQNFIISHYNYKNMKINLAELNAKINEDDIERKTEKIYCNNHVIKRILPLLKAMKEKEINIDRFEKIISSGSKNIAKNSFNK
jgi:hypothetical protein